MTDKQKPFKRRLNLTVSKIESEQLDELCKLLQETPNPIVRRCINEMHKKHEREFKKDSK